MSTAVHSELTADVNGLLGQMGVPPEQYQRGTLPARTPITGETLGHATEASVVDAARAIDVGHAAFLDWRYALRLRGAVSPQEVRHPRRVL
jgi:acyl-CoA reductase-like NAD-dependent aldehyde dehydrogenase